MTEEKVWLTNENGIKIVTLTQERLPETLKLMREYYYTQESASRGLELQANQEAIDDLELLSVETFRDGASLIALKNDQLVGVSFNKVQTTPAPGEVPFFVDFKDNKCKTDRAKEYIDCMIRMDAKKDVFDHYGVRSSLEVMFICVASPLRRQGVAPLLVLAGMEVAREQNLPLINAVFTSNASQRVGACLKWDQLITVPMSEHVYDGKPYSHFTGENQTMILMAQRL